LPRERNGYLTFGSFNHVGKLNGLALQLWFEVLHAAPGSRMLIGAVPDKATAVRIRRFFLDAGIDESRVECLPRLPRAEYLAAMRRVDVALDTFPYCGGSTTCDLLWMGIPVVTLAGLFGFSRSCAALLSAVNLRDLVAETHGQYLAAVQQLARSPLLPDLRAGLRERMRASPLMDESGFVRRLESLYLSVPEGGGSLC
jgi:predicted O-linked N-acetylglucosamine transferase (SPINDLY family)